MPKVSGEVEIVPGVVGPARIVDDGRHALATPAGGIGLRLDIRFDQELRRYVCHGFCAVRDAEGGGPVTTEALRQVTLAQLIAASLFVGGPVIRELGSAGDRDPWGLAPPADLTEGGPTDRALRWVGHLYRYGYAVNLNPTATVEDTLKLARSTTGRWIAMARKAGHLGAAAGAGKAGG